MKIGLTKRGNPLFVFKETDPDAPGIESPSGHVTPSFELQELSVLFGMKKVQAAKKSGEICLFLTDMKQAIKDAEASLADHDAFRAWRESQGIEDPPPPPSKNAPDGPEIDPDYKGEGCEVEGDPVSVRLT